MNGLVNWEAVHVVLLVVGSLIGFANVYILLRIDKRIAEAVDAIKDWCRSEFVTQREADLRFEASSKGK